MRIDLVDAEHQPVVAELDIRRDTVEIRCLDTRRRNRLVAVQDRQALLDWLTNPDGVLSRDDTTWAYNGHNISLHIVDFVPSEFLRPHVIERLKTCLL